jgi:pimeloyl-ACP methyl ester carboxylesterase
METPISTSGYAPVNGLSMYYETHGEGPPLVLIHGGFGSTGMLGPIVPTLAGSRQVITYDVQGHGRTGDIDRPLKLDLLADDVAGLLRHLGHAQADVMGYSLGGAIALHTAFHHPDMVRKLVVVAAPMQFSGWFPDTQQAFAQMGPAMAEALKATPLYESYAAIAPNPAAWERLHDKYHDLLSVRYDWSESVAAMTIPTMLVFGDADAVQLSHAVEFFRRLGGGLRDGGWDGSGRSSSRLAILPGVTHYNILASPLLGHIVPPFLDGVD